MDNNDKKYGTLLQPSILLHRQYFREMVRLLGVRVIYRYPLKDKKYTTYADIDSSYSPPMLIGCIFDDHPTQQTLKKMGWVSELSENASIIHVDYDLPNLQQGSLFIIPSGLDNGKGRLFRVSKITNSIVYPASVACEIVPEFEDTFDDETGYDFENHSMTLINEEKDRVFAYNDDDCQFTVQ